MESKKITQLATEVAPLLDDLTFIGDPITGQLKKVTLNQIAYIFGAGSAWGTITGTLSNQTDLQAALNLKVPYTGATANVNLGAYNITATSLIKNGGVGTQFLKADGSIDNNTYLTADDLPSTLSLYATTAAASVSGYFKLVTTIDDPDFNITAVDVSTGEITTIDQLISSLVSPANLINGNPGVFNVTTYGNIKKVSGSGQAEFYFKVYKRTAAGVETLVGTSSNTIPVVNTGYSEFFATAIWNDGIFGVTDTIVLKYYATRISGGSNPTYNFQFGGVSPVRTIVPIPTAVIPNIYLADLEDVEDGVASNNDGIYYDSSVSLWKYKSVAEALGYTPANDASVVHLAGAETITGFKTINNGLNVKGQLFLGGLSYGGSISYLQGSTSATSGDTTTTEFLDNNTIKYHVGQGSTNYKYFVFDVSAIGLNATRTYTFPNASGTLALTSNLASYVPYTGATSGVNLGGNDLTGGSFIANGISSYSGSISLKQNGLILAYSGYTTLSSSSAGKLNIYFGDASAYAVTLQNNLLTDSRSYNFPNASGTIALVGGSGVGTVTSVAALTIGTSGTDLSSSVANSTTTPVITLNVPTASATNRGALSSTDWSTFSAKQNALTLTTTGTSGAATLVGATLNIPNYAPDLSGYVTLATTQTISGLKTFTSLLTAADFTNGFLTISGGTIDRTTTGTAIELQYAGNGPIRFFGSTAWPILFSSTSGIATFSNSITATSFIKSGGTSSQYLMADGSTSTLTNPVTGTGTTNYLPKFTGASTIGNSGISDNGTTISTTENLSIGRVLTISHSFNPYITFDITGGQQWQWAGEGSALRVYNITAGTNPLTLNTSGNLGLGVTPSAGGLSGYVLFELANGGASIYSGANQNLNGTNISWSGGTASYKISNFATLYNQQSGQHQWYTAPSGTAGNAISFTQAMTLTAAGRLLLGTPTESTYKLDVNGTARVTSNLLAQKVQVGTAATINDATGVGNTLQFANYSAGVFVTGSADSYIYKTSGAFGGLSAQTLIFQTRSDVAGGGFAFVAGSTPSAVLSIASTGAATFSNSVTNTSGMLLNVGATGTNANMNYTTFTNGVYSALNSATPSEGVGMWSDNLGNAMIGSLYNATASSLNLVVRASSSVSGLVALKLAGTGAASFSSSVTAGGTITLNNASANYATLNLNGASGYGAELKFGEATGGYLAAIRHNYNVGTGLEFYTGGTGAGSLRMYIAPTGNVGIGTSSPSYLLDLQTGYSTNKTLLRLGNNTASAANGDKLNIDFFSYNDNYINARISREITDYTTYAGALTFSTGQSNSVTERARITSGGNVLIGTTTDNGSKLSVNGSAFSASFNSSTGVYTRYKYNGTNVGIIGTANQIIGGGSTTAFAIGTESNDYMLFITNNAERLRIASTGAATFSSSVSTGAPSGGTAKPWKLGAYQTNTVIFDTAHYVQVEIDGVAYRLALAL